MMDRETQVKSATEFCEALDGLFQTFSQRDFDQSVCLEDTLDPSDHLKVYRAGLMFRGLMKLLDETRWAAHERRAKIDSQVITRADLRRWLEGRK